VTVRFKPQTGAEQSQRATLAAGGAVGKEFTPADTPSSPPRVETPPPPREGEPPGWALPAALVAGGVAIVGAGVFIGFKLKSDSIYDDLQRRCGPSSCGPADRADADEGKRDQNIATVGLVVGGVAAASAIAFVLVRAYGPRNDARAEPIQIGPGSFRATF
jgi:hypothetical protein